MMIDVNILLAAARADHSHHTKATRWLQDALEQCDAGTLILSIPLMVIASFLRLITQEKIYPNPATTAQAVSYIDWLLDCQGVRVVEQGREWQHLRTLCLSKHLIHNDIPDAWLASVVQSHGDVLVTFDKGFKKLLPASQVQIL